MDSKKIEFLEDTIPLMLSASYEDRFKAEYYQLKIRRNKLKDMLVKWRHGKLSFTPKCDDSQLAYQIDTMGDYLSILEDRARIEKIEL